MDQPKTTPEEQTHDPKGIVSVNSRTGESNNMIGKIIFVIAVFSIVIIGALFGYNRHRTATKVANAAESKITKEENKPAATGPRRSFDTDPPPLPGAQSKVVPVDAKGAACADGTQGTVMLGQDGKPFKSPDGSAMRVCKDGRVVVPAIQLSQAGAQPIPVTGNPQAHQVQPQRASRYTGDVMVASLSGNYAASAAKPFNETTNLAMEALKNLGGQNRLPQNNSAITPEPQGGGTSPPGSIGNQLKPSHTAKVSASMLGDRNMILPKGRTIDCGLSMKLVNEVAGMASCVLTQNVYSDNGRVVLLERGSEATGEYGAAMAQGQRRLFVLWTRIKTPEGVVIELNSPAADSLGTSGLDGFVDNHWWDRLGAAFLLSLVQDAIAYETATGTGGSGASNLAVFQNTTQTGNKMAEKVLESTINIKPTLYRNQGTRGTIYVARDLDFGSVYALQAR